MQRRIAQAAGMLSATLLLAGMASHAQAKQTDEDLHRLFVSMASAQPYVCGPSMDDQTEKAEDAIVQAAEDRALEALNAGVHTPEQAKAIIAQALEPFAKLSEETEAAWPKETRWHFEVVEILPAVAIQFTYRDKVHFRATGIVPGSEKSKPLKWQHLGEDSWEGSAFTSWSQAKISPLNRGPANAVRFLVSMQGGGCAGSYGVQYSIEEWNPGTDSDLHEVMSQSGAEGMDDPLVQAPTKKVPFPKAGVLKTDGARITLPYCQFTQLDTWDNPSLCMVDTYDLSGDDVAFVSRRYNRPDLAPVAKVLEYAKTHDLPALRGYCASEAVARKILRELPGGYGFDAELETVPMGAGREGVRPAYSGVPGFVVEKHGDRWIVVSFDAGQK